MLLRRWGMGDAITDDFWAAVVETIPAKGEWFPRVDVLDVSPDAERELAFRFATSTDSDAGVEGSHPAIFRPANHSESERPGHRIA